MLQSKTRGQDSSSKLAIPSLKIAVNSSLASHWGTSSSAPVSTPSFQVEVPVSPKEVVLDSNSFKLTGVHGSGVDLSARLTYLRSRMGLPIDDVNSELAKEVDEILQHRFLFEVEANLKSVECSFMSAEELQNALPVAALNIGAAELKKKRTAAEAAASTASVSVTQPSSTSGLTSSAATPVTKKAAVVPSAASSSVPAVTATASAPQTQTQKPVAAPSMPADPVKSSASISSTAPSDHSKTIAVFVRNLPTSVTHKYLFTQVFSDDDVDVASFSLSGPVDANAKTQTAELQFHTRAMAELAVRRWNNKDVQGRPMRMSIIDDTPDESSKSTASKAPASNPAPSAKAPAPAPASLAAAASPAIAQTVSTPLLNIQSLPPRSAAPSAPASVNSLSSASKTAAVSSAASGPKPVSLSASNPVVAPKALTSTAVASGAPSTATSTPFEPVFSVRFDSLDKNANAKPAPSVSSSGSQQVQFKSSQQKPSQSAAASSSNASPAPVPVEPSVSVPVRKVRGRGAQTFFGPDKIAERLETPAVHVQESTEIFGDSEEFGDDFEFGQRFDSGGKKFRQNKFRNNSFGGRR